MHNDFFAWVRLLLFIILILVFALYCSIAETRFRMEQPEPTEPEQKKPTYIAQATPHSTTPLKAEPATEPTFRHPLSSITPDAEPAAMAVDTPPAPQKHKPQAETPQEDPTETVPTGEWISLGTYTLTAYCPCQLCCGEHALDRPLDENGNPIVYTSIGAVAQAGTTIAVDPSVIPYGSYVKIRGNVYRAQDTGGAIVGNRIDVYFDDHQAAWDFGKQEAEVFILS